MGKQVATLTGGGNTNLFSITFIGESGEKPEAQNFLF